MPSGERQRLRFIVFQSVLFSNGTLESDSRALEIAIAPVDFSFEYAA
jgi:hypothetical protein